ncbi:MAG: pseudouridine-5'-phosphate glycosidase [Acidobacteria bacterium]|nr:pseudouridine-5'-phosphate glycosidase [Acidobacteriota bacterium]
MFSLSPSVAAALNRRKTVVALESTAIAHGLPSPQNLETAQACETAVRESGALPATIGIIGGRAVIGLNRQQIEEIAIREDVEKVNLANLARVIADGKWGATTVASSLHLARMAGIEVFATGGIGGVHRGASDSFDISSDLIALARYPLITVCAGAKAILDLSKTLEVLETIGVPVVGYQTDELPAFYSRSSDLKLDLHADGPEQVVAIARAHWRLGFSTALLVVAPVPVEDEVPADEMKDAIDESLSLAAGLGISGKEVTPFLLSQIAERTEGRALRANIALLRNNARIAGGIASALTEQE